MSLPLTSPELTLTRGEGQKSRIYAAIFKPSTVYSARLDTLPSSFDKVYQIAFTSGVGTLTDVLKDMDLWVGSSAGAHDLGIARIRKVPIAGIFYISEESDVRWQTDCHLTVVNYYDLHARHINVVDDDTFYMDYDVAYVDQHTDFDPIVRMGGHRVLKLTGASVSSVWTGAASSVIGSSISVYAWSCTTASGSSGTSTATPTFTFNTIGWHLVYLTVTSATGKTATSVRYVYVYDVDNLPAPIFDIGNPSVDYDTGGWSFEFSMSAADVADVPDRALVILFREDQYGSTAQSIGALAGHENIECVGKIAEESLTLDPEQNTVTFRVQGYHWWFQRIMGYPSGLRQVTSSPTLWTDMQNLTVDKALFHFLHWRTTATVIMDCYFTGDTRLASELSSPAASLWAQIQEFSFNTILARPGVDRFGRLHVFVEPQCVPLADRNFPSVMTLQAGDWEPPVQIDRVTVEENGQISLSGVSVDAANSGIALFSLSPGHVMKHYGTIETIDRLLLENQSLSNEQAGLLLAWRDNEFPSIEMPLTMNNPVFDCFPPMVAAWTLDAGNNARGISIDGDLIPRHVERRINSDSGFVQTMVTFELATDASLANYLTGDTPGSDDTSTPPTVPDYPDLPDFPVILPGDIVPDVSYSNTMIVHDAGSGLKGFAYTESFDSGSPLWNLCNGGLTAQQYQGANFLYVTPSGVVYCGKIEQRNDNNDGPFLAWAPIMGGAWTVLYDRNNLRTGAGDWGIKGFGIDHSAPDRVGVIMKESADGNTPYFWLGTSHAFTKKGAVAGSGYTFNWGVSYGLGKWLISSYGAQADGKNKISSNDGTTWTLAVGQNANANPNHIRAGITGITYHDRVGNGMFVGANNCATLTENTDANITMPAVNVDGSNNAMAVDPTGQKLMTQYPAGSKGRSTDGGTSWSALSNLPVGASWKFCYLGGAKWAAVGATVYYSPDDGASWLNYTGNLSSGGAVPFPALNMVAVNLGVLT